MYNELISKSDFIKSFQPVAKQIESLADGGIRLQAEDYLLIRDHEKKEITNARVKKFAPRNVLGAAIKYLRIFQESGSVNVNTETLPGDNSIWERFINNVDGSETTLKEFAINIFETAAKVKYAFIKVDLPYQEIPQELNEYAAENLDANRVPYLTEIPISSILSFGEVNNRVAWIKYAHVEAIDNPFSQTIYNLHIIVIDDNEINRFVYENVQVNSDNTIYKIWDASISRGTGGYRKILKNERPTTIHEPIYHNRGVCPVILFELPDSLWQANQVYKTQAVVHGLGMNMLHTVANAGFVQKWGTPFIQASPNSGTGLQQIPIPKDALAEIVDKYAKSLGDESILMMQSFNFEELNGSSIDIQNSIIDSLCNYIFNSIIYRQNILEKHTNVQTGTAKEFDREAQVLALKANGKKIIGLIQNILKHSSRCLRNVSESDIDKISVSGMNDFNLRPISSALETVERLAKIPSDKIPASLMAKAVSQLSIAMSENDSQEEKQQIIQEISDLYAA